MNKNFSCFEALQLFEVVSAWDFGHLGRRVVDITWLLLFDGAGN